jgi:hypothetical protein
MPLSVHAFASDSSSLIQRVLERGKHRGEKYLNYVRGRGVTKFEILMSYIFKISQQFKNEQS